MVRSLLNTSHPINVGYAACLRRNNPYAPSDTPVTYSNAGNYACTICFNVIYINILQGTVLLIMPLSQVVQNCPQTPQTVRQEGLQENSRGALLVENRR